MNLVNASFPHRPWIFCLGMMTMMQSSSFNSVMIRVPAERALTWHCERGLIHHTVDDGENRTFRMKGSPIMVNDSEFDTENIIKKFKDLAGDIDFATDNFILENIQSTDKS